MYTLFPDNSEDDCFTSFCVHVLHSIGFQPFESRGLIIIVFLLCCLLGFKTRRVGSIVAQPLSARKFQVQIEASITSVMRNIGTECKLHKANVIQQCENLANSCSPSNLWALIVCFFTVMKVCKFTLLRFIQKIFHFYGKT